MGKDANDRRYTQAEVNRMIAEATRPLLEMIAQQQAQIEQLEAKLARLTRDSRTSSTSRLRVRCGTWRSFITTRCVTTTRWMC